MNKRNRSNGLRLGGEFYRRGELPAMPVVVARVYYLSAVARLDTEFSAALSSEVAPCWARLAADDPRADGIPQLYAAARSVVESIGLPPEWAEPCALAAWFETEDRPELPELPEPVLRAKFSDPETFRPELFFFRSDWPLVEVETRQQAAARIRAEFEKELNVYLDAIEDQAKAAGMERTPQKRARKGDATQHYEWLARSEVQGWSHAQIAKYYRVEKGTVETAVRATAKHVGLTRRTLRPGTE